MIFKEEKEKLAELAAGKKLCVEIGSYLGTSALAITNNFQKDQKLICIDIWESSSKRPDPIKGTLYENFLKNTAGRNITTIRDYSYNAVEYFIRENLKIDFLFIDGDHSELGVYRDWMLYRLFLTGVVVFYDWAWESVRYIINKYVNQIKSYHSLENLWWGYL